MKRATFFGLALVIMMGASSVYAKGQQTYSETSKSNVSQSYNNQQHATDKTKMGCKCCE